MSKQWKRDEEGQAGSVRSRLSLVVTVLFLSIGILVWRDFDAAREIRAAATAAEVELTAAQSSLTTGDVPGAKTHVAAAKADVVIAQEAAQRPSIRISRFVPVLGGAFEDVDHLINSADLITSATGKVVDVYGVESGADGHSQGIAQNGRIDLTTLADVSSRLKPILVQLSAARAELGQVHASLPGLGSVALARDAAISRIDPLIKSMQTADKFLPFLPNALGASEPKNYLIAVLNQGEMRAGGGCPLSIALITVRDGAFRIVLRAPVAQLPQLDAADLEWIGFPGSPWNDAQGLRRGRFTASNRHPDFRASGMELVRAWTSAGYPKVDGVVGIDLSGVANLLASTGPVETSAFGTITSANILKVLLFDAYRTYAADQGGRQRANQEVVDAVMKRLTNGGSAIGVVKALVGSVPSRHVQIYALDPKLEALLHSVDADGSLADGVKDRVAVFNSSEVGGKADIFLSRKVSVRVRVNADGSAHEVQTVTVKNQAPHDSVSAADNTGYLNGMTRARYMVVLPEAALAPRISPGSNFVGSDWPSIGQWTNDGFGRRIGQVLGSLNPGQEGSFEVTYDLPAGTFLQNGALRYSSVVEPQPTVVPEEVQIDMSGPSGTSGSFTGVASQRLDVSIPVGTVG
jgi:Protein of unknown function (DUF4012)